MPSACLYHVLARVKVRSTHVHTVRCARRPGTPVHASDSAANGRMACDGLLISCLYGHSHWSTLRAYVLIRLLIVLTLES